MTDFGEKVPITPLQIPGDSKILLSSFRRNPIQGV